LISITAHGVDRLGVCLDLRRGAIVLRQSYFLADTITDAPNI